MDQARLNYRCKMNYFRRRKQNLDTDLKRMEAKLAEYLHPVSPRLSFTKGLQDAILSGEISVRTQLFSQKTTNRLLVAGGLIGSILVLVTSIRGLISIIGILNLVLRRYTQEKQASPA